MSAAVAGAAVSAASATPARKNLFMTSPEPDCPARQLSRQTRERIHTVLGGGKYPKNIHSGSRGQVCTHYGQRGTEMITREAHQRRRFVPKTGVSAHDIAP
jgi:hypothetical protein